MQLNISGKRVKIFTSIGAFTLVIILILTYLYIRTPIGEERVIDTFSGSVESLTFPISYSPQVINVPVDGAHSVKKATLTLQGRLPQNSTFIHVGRLPISVTSGDFNGDGKKDIAAVSYKEGEVYTLLNKGNGKIDFYSPNVYEVSDNPIKIDSGDINGDGSEDLAILGESGWIEVLLNTGDGHFITENPNITAGQTPKDIVVADINGNGKDEILTISEADDILRAFSMDEGGLKESFNITTQHSPTALCVADVNGDGKEDLLISNSADRDATINEGGSPRRYFYTLSLFTSTSGGFVHKGDWTVGKNPNDITAADIDGDGDMDAVVSCPGEKAISTLINDHGTFKRDLSPPLDSVQYFSSDPQEVKSADLNMDGISDVITVCSSSDSVEVFTFLANGSLKSTSTYYVGVSPVTLTVDDFDSDQDKDIVVGNHDPLHENDPFGTLSTLENLFYGVFSPIKYYTVGASPRGIYSSDVDSDGNLDIGTANYFGSTVSIIYGNGVGEFSKPVFVPIGLEPYSVIMTDLDGDGDKDIASADEARNVVIVVMNQGGGVFSGIRPAYYVQGYPIAMKSVDIDGDGDTDLITANHAQREICILYNSGEGTFNDTKIIPLVKYMPFDIAVGDLNSDGIEDIVTANIGSDKFFGDNITVVFGRGEGNYSAPIEYKVGIAPSSVSLFDMDLDGDLDVVVTDMRSDSVTLFKNAGDGSLVDKRSIPVGIMPQSAYPVDLNNDGLKDLVITNTGTNDISVLINSGGGVFIPLYRTPAGSYPYMITKGDFNGDRSEDIAYTNVNVNNIGVMEDLYYPKDVKVDVGFDLNVDWKCSSYLSGEVTIDLTDAFNQYLKDHSGAVPIAFTSLSEGLVKTEVEVETK